jgi:hypothetical protein
MKAFCSVLALISVLMCACPNHTNYQNQSIIKIENAVKKAEKWMEIPGVTGVKQVMQDARPCIKVLVSVIPDSVRTKIPETYFGYPVLIQYVGQVD